MLLSAGPAVVDLLFLQYYNPHSSMNDPLVKWEYMTVMLRAGGVWLGGNIDGQVLTDKLNELGKQGWELVNVFDTNMLQGQTRDVFAVLKRPSK